MMISRTIRTGTTKNLGFKRLVVEEPHAKESAYRAADPGPEEECPLGHSALVLFCARLVISIQDARCEIN